MLCNNYNKVTELPYLCGLEEKKKEKRKRSAPLSTPARPHLPGLSGSHPALGAGWPRVTHVRKEGVRRDRHLSGRFSTNVMLHGNHTCRASRTGQTGVGGPERKRTVVTVVLSPHSAEDDEVEGKKKSKAGEEKLQFRLYMKKKKKKNPGYFHLIPSSQLPCPPPPFLH